MLNGWPEAAMLHGISLEKASACRNCSEVAVVGMSVRIPAGLHEAWLPAQPR